MPRSTPNYSPAPRPPKTPYRLYTNPHTHRLTVEFLYLGHLPVHLELPTPVTSLLSIKYRDLLPLATREAIVTEVLTSPPQSCSCDPEFEGCPICDPEPLKGTPCPPTPTLPSSSPAASTPSPKN